MSSLCCPSTKPYQDRPNSTPHEAKFIAFLAAYPTLSTKPISPGGSPPPTKFKYIIQLLQDQDNGNNLLNRFFGCQDSTNARSNPVPIIPRPSAPKMSGLPPAAAPSSSLPGSEPSPPYRPRFNTNGTAAKPMKRAENSYGSGWSQQRSSASASASASWTSGSSHNNNSNNNGYQPSNTNINSFPPPKRTNSGPPSWVSKDAADSSSSWRTNNPKRPQPGSSTSPVSTSPQTPRSPNSFGGRGPFPPKSATNGGASKRPFGGQYLRPPSVARSSASHSERDSSWESASTATDTTWNNRFASLGGNDEDDEDDGDETASDNSGGLDSQRFEQAVNSLVNQDDEYDDLSVVMRSPSDLSTNWRKAVEPVISFVEIAERDVKKSGLIKDGNLKMWRCIPHNTLFKIHVYVPGNENGL